MPDQTETVTVYRIDPNEKYIVQLDGECRQEECDYWQDRVDKWLREKAPILVLPDWVQLEKAIGDVKNA